jgi:hypothetical protein
MIVSDVSQARVFTTHRTVFYVDGISGELRHGLIETSPVNAFLKSHQSHNYLLHCRDGYTQPIVCLRDHSRSISLAGRHTKPTMFDLVELPQGLIGLRAEDQFLCAEPDGRVSLSRTVCSSWESFLLSEGPRCSEILDAIGLLKPYDIPRFPKKRIGRQGDGGYVLLDDFNSISVVYSIGIGDEVSFDMELAARGKQVFMFDHTVDRPPLIHPNFHFFKHGIGAANDASASTYTLDHEIHRLGHAGRSDLLLKVDIEGGELEIFSQMTDTTLQQFRQIVMEVHWLSRLGDRSYRTKFIDTLSNVNRLFTLFHAHADNAHSICLVGGYVVADVLELSYVRSDLIERTPSRSIYPTILDFANWPARPDHLLWFHPFMPAIEASQSGYDKSFRNSLAISNRRLRPISSISLMHGAPCDSLLDLAESYRDFGRLPDAAQAFDEMAWYARWQEARCLRDNNDEDRFVQTALAAFQDRPTRAEPLHDLCNFYIGKQRGSLAATYAEAAISVPKPEKDIVSVDSFMYATGFRHAFAAAAKWSENAEQKERGRRICDWLAVSRDIPEHIRASARYDSGFYAVPAQSLLPSLQFHPLSIPAPKGFHPVNIAICRWGDQLIGIVRAANWKLTDTGWYEIGEDSAWRSHIMFVHLDHDLRVVCFSDLHPPQDMPPPQYALEIGFADPRPFVWRGDVWCVAAVAQLNRSGLTEMVLARIDQTRPQHFVLTDWRVVPSGMPPRWEKNWMPQVVGDELRLIYSVDPTRILADSGDVLLNEPAPIAAENFRGGSQAIAFDDGWLMVIHEVERGNARSRYFHRFVWMDCANKLRRLSRRFYLQQVGYEYVAGMAQHPDGDRLILGCSVNCLDLFLAVVNANDVRAMLMDIDEHKRASENAVDAARSTWERLRSSKLR